MDENDIKKLLPKRPKNSNKGTFGHVLNIAGCGFYTGAAYFSSVSALKVGCGRVTLASAETALSAVSALTPDVILMPLAQNKEKTIQPKAIKQLESIFKNYEAISVGCGLSTNKHTAEFFKKTINILATKATPVVIDADGLNILAKSDIKKLPQNLILTPHPMEMARLMGVEVDEIINNQELWARKCSEKYNCVTVLKTHKTFVCQGEKIYINNSGNSALAHGGSGDVLCGMVTGFLAQGMKPFEASVLAVYLHGKTAEIASEKLTEYSTLASDLLKYIYKSIKKIS